MTWQKIYSHFSLDRNAALVTVTGTKIHWKILSLFHTHTHVYIYFPNIMLIQSINDQWTPQSTYKYINWTTKIINTNISRNGHVMRRQALTYTHTNTLTSACLNFPVPVFWLATVITRILGSKVTWIFCLRVCVSPRYFKVHSCHRQTDHPRMTRSMRSGCDTRLHWPEV